VAVLPAWKLDAVYCASIKVGAPQLSLAALCALHELLIACESQQVSADDNIVTEAQDGTTGTTGVLVSEQIIPDAPHQIRAADLTGDQVVAALKRKGRPCRVDSEKQISMFPDT
jgi:hypothetical protein